MSDCAVTIRQARAGEAVALTDLALRAKAHWGYDAAFMEMCRDELTITEAQVATDTVLVADKDDSIVGTATLIDEGDGSGSIESMFVEPALIGQGVGRRLLAAVIERARAKGLHQLTADADPNARGFYERQGFRYLRDVPSGSIAGRSLPQLVAKI